MTEILLDELIVASVPMAEFLMWEETLVEALRHNWEEAEALKRDAIPIMEDEKACHSVHFSLEKIAMLIDTDPGERTTLENEIRAYIKFITGK